MQILTGKGWKIVDGTQKLLVFSCEITSIPLEVGIVDIEHPKNTSLTEIAETACI